MPIAIPPLAGDARRHQQSIGAVAVQHDALGAIQHPRRAILPRRGGDIGEVVARLPLDMRERQLQLALRDLRQQRLLLRGVAGAPQQSAAQDDGGEVRLQHQAAAERLHHDHRLDRPAAEAAMRFGERQAEQAEFGVLLPDGAAPAVRLGHVLLALLELVLVGDQPIDAVLQQALFVGEVEVHGGIA